MQILTGVPTSLPYYPKHHLQNSWPSFRIQSQALSLPEPCAILCRTFWWSVDAASAQWWSTSNRGSSTSSQKFYFRFPNTLIPYKKRLIALNLFPVSHWHEIRDWVFSHKERIHSRSDHTMRETWDELSHKKRLVWNSYEMHNQPIRKVKRVWKYMVLLIRDTVIVTLLSYPLELLRISYAACERDYDLSSVKCVCQCKLLQPEKKAMRQANI